MIQKVEYAISACLVQVSIQSQVLYFLIFKDKSFALPFEIVMESSKYEDTFI